MNRQVLAAVLSGCMTVPLAAQTPSDSAASGTRSGSETVLRTLTGCVARDDAAHFTLSDIANGTYELTGTDVRPYVGRRVRVKGLSLGGLHIVGGLWPTPNVAAQAGAIDPVQAAIAAMPGGTSRGTGPAAAHEFRVDQVRPVKGQCP